MTSDSHAQQVADEIEKRLDDPSALIVAEAATLLRLAPPQLLKALYEQELGEAPTVMGHAMKASLANAMRPDPAGLGAAFFGSIKIGREKARRRTIIAVVESFIFKRLLSSLNENERAVLRAMAALYAAGEIGEQDWRVFHAQLTFADAQCSIEPPAHLTGNDHEAIARRILTVALKNWLTPYDAFLKEKVAFVASHQREDSAVGRRIARLLSPGARWGGDGDDWSDSRTFSETPSAGSLLIGFGPESGKPVYYSHNESLITIASPGTGKSQGQVIPNLLMYPGSAVVLDVKGELWEATAAERKEKFGPVFRFAPTDFEGESHCYNPMDFISSDPVRAASDCELLANQIIQPNDEIKDPYWNNRARDFLWAFAMVVAIHSPPEERNLASIMDLFSIPTSFEDAESPEFLRSPTAALLTVLESLAEKHQLPALGQIATAIRTGLDQSRLESVLDNGRGFLSIFARSQLLRQTMRRSDWTPLDLRKPGTTIYFCLPGDDIEAYLPIVRVMLQQHASALLRDVRHSQGVPPITFFLDEMPQLGPIKSLQRLLDVGRGAGVRLWLFAQYLGQLRRLYGRDADGLINACRVRCFMQPDNDAAELLRPQLGATRNLFDGKEQPLAHAYELMGPQFADRIIVTARGEAPMQLQRRFAWEFMQQKPQEASGTAAPAA